jgi:transcriptional regulator with XRE-family HTH domain
VGKIIPAGAACQQNFYVIFAPAPTHVSEFERGLREPSLLALLQYARLAGVSTDVLIDDELDLPAKLKSRVR